MSRKIVICFILALSLLFTRMPVSQASGPDGTVAQDIKNRNKKSDKTDQGNPSAKTKEKAPVQASAGSSTFMTFLKLLAAMVVILGLIYILYRFVSKRTRVYQNYGAIRNIGGVSVGQNRSVQLIRIGEEILVIGVGDTVQLLKEINDPALVDDLLEEKEVPDVLSKNVTKVFSWAKDAAQRKLQERQNSGPKQDLTGKRENATGDFTQQLKKLLKARTRGVEKEIRKDSDDE